MGNKIEILSPAGSYESLKAAIAAGADAVYVGGSRFGARAFADNFTEEELLEAIDYVHLCGKRIYLAINTLFKEEELKNQLYSYLLPYYCRGIDAVIVQDIGVLQFVKEQFPGLPIHASTQMTITNLLGAQLLEELGVERVVTARELQLEEIREIAEHTNLEIESFVHGALCYSYSGQCLYSSLLGGRSGNRGQCAQPCRLPYCTAKDQKDRYLLSLKDICTLELIPDLVESGIYSFKIEGRMKKPEYVALVTAMYRKYTDLYLAQGREKYDVEESDKQALMDLYNRGGFHTGYYRTRNGRKMVSISRPNHAGVEALRVTKCNGRQITGKALTELHKGDVIELPQPKENYTLAQDVTKGESISILSHQKQNMSQILTLYRVRNEQLIRDIRENIIQQDVKTTINGTIFLKEDEPMRLLVDDGMHFVEVTGAKCQRAMKQATDMARIRKQLDKTGNTLFRFQDIHIYVEGELFIPLQELNELRRNALEQLAEQICMDYRRTSVKQGENWTNETKDYASDSMVAYALARTMEQFQMLCEESFIKRIYVDCNMLSNIWQNSQCKDLVDKGHACGKEIFLAMPHIFRKSTKERYESWYQTLCELWDGVLIRNYESFYFLKNHNYDKVIVTDHHLYAFNKEAKSFWARQGVSATTAPYELNEKELRDLGLIQSELVVYGYQPMMVSAQCVMNTTEGCIHKPSQLYLKDRYQKQFCACNYCDYCYNIIYNTLPLALFDQQRKIQSLMPQAVRLEFSIEDAKQTRQVLNNYKRETEPDFAFTRGHFKRGIK